MVILAVQTVAMIALCGSLFVLAARHPLRLDLTPERRFTLSPHSREVLARLDGDVRITGFFSSQDGAAHRMMSDLMALYADASPRIGVRLVDLDRNPGLAHELDVGEYNTLVVQAGERRERIDTPTEEDVTAALLRVGGTPPVTTYFVTGHGEHDPRDADGRSGAGEATRALVADGFAVRVVEGIARVPDDAGLVVLAGPTRELVSAEVEALVAWVRRGGALLVLADPDAPRSVDALLAPFGIALSHDLVVDDQARLFGTDGLSARVPVLNQTLVPDAPDANALLPVAQSVRVLDAPGVRGDYLALTGESSWADADRRAPSAGTRAFREGRDHPGPIPVAAVARISGESGRDGRLAVVGDADFVTNLHVNLVGNRDLLLATAGLIARSDPLAAARPDVRPGGTFSPLILTAREARLVFWGGVVAPAAALATVALALARRRT